MSKIHATAMLDPTTTTTMTKNALNLVNSSPSMLLPASIFESDHQPIDYFRLFFDQGIFQLLATNTNAHAESKGARTATTRSGRYWKPVTTACIQAFIAVLIFLSLEGSKDIQRYWKQIPQLTPIWCITYFRFRQIQRYFISLLFII